MDSSGAKNRRSSWKAACVRVVTGLATAFGCLYLLDVTITIIAHRGSIELPAWITNAVAIPMLILGAVVYRIVSRKIIRGLALDDPRNPHGHPAGHMERIRAFSFVLGVSVWLTGSALSREVVTREVGRFGVGGAFSSMIVGWAVYRITLRWMTPPTKPALPPGKGFEVLPMNCEK
jgi:hypothetical protein